MTESRHHVHSCEVPARLVLDQHCFFHQHVGFYVCLCLFVLRACVCVRTCVLCQLMPAALKGKKKAELITFAAQACLLPVCFERSVTAKLLIGKSAFKLLTETADYWG